MYGLRQPQKPVIWLVHTPGLMSLAEAVGRMREGRFRTCRNHGSNAHCCGLWSTEADVYVFSLGIPSALLLLITTSTSWCPRRFYNVKTRQRGSTVHSNVRTRAARRTGPKSVWGSRELFGAAIGVYVLWTCSRPIVSQRRVLGSGIPEAHTEENGLEEAEMVWP
jgi:hypothetical protein